MFRETWLQRGYQLLASLHQSPDTQSCKKSWSVRWRFTNDKIIATRWWGFFLSQLLEAILKRSHCICMFEDTLFFVRLTFWSYRANEAKERHCVTLQRVGRFDPKQLLCAEVKRNMISNHKRSFKEYNKKSTSGNKKKILQVTTRSLSFRQPTSI